jgi:hypothetical protein
MERAFDFNRVVPLQERILDVPVQLFNQHLIIQSDLARQFCGENRQVFAVFLNDQSKILLANTDDTAFKAKHKPIMLFVKQKNSRGDKSISLQEFFADWPEAPQQNRELEYQLSETEPILEISLK